MSPSSQWIRIHWRWVIMLVVVFGTAIALVKLGVWLRRRYQFRSEAARAYFAIADGHAYKIPTSSMDLPVTQAQRPISDIHIPWPSFTRPPNLASGSAVNPQYDSLSDEEAKPSPPRPVRVFINTSKIWTPDRSFVGQAPPAAYGAYGRAPNPNRSFCPPKLWSPSV